jgi:hypothetical protein
MTTNREKFEKVFSKQIADAKINDGIYAPGISDEECIRTYVVEHHLSEEDAVILLQEKRAEWMAHKGERMFYYMQVIQMGTVRQAHILRAWENELIDMFDTHDFEVDDESGLPYTVNKNA